MKGVHPFTSLARPPLAWGFGPARGCEQRASRARRLAAPGRRTPSLAVRVLDDETTIVLPEGSPIARPHGVATTRTTRRSGANESRGAAIATSACSKENPGSISPGHLLSPIGCARRRNTTCDGGLVWFPHRRSKWRNETEPMGRRPSRSTERHRAVARVFDGLGVAPREGREPGDDRDAFCPSG